MNTPVVLHNAPEHQKGSFSRPAPQSRTLKIDAALRDLPLKVVKTILNFSQIIYLKKGQVLYEQGFNERYLYVILFGRLRLSQHETDA